MPGPPNPEADAQMDAVIGRLLQAGVLVSALVVLAGGALYLWRHGASMPEYRVFHGQPSDLRSIGGILGDLPSLRSRAVIQLGLLLLVATPVARVVFSVYAFARQRDWTYVLVTLVVLGVLLWGVLGGRA